MGTWRCDFEDTMSEEDVFMRDTAIGLAGFSDTYTTHLIARASHACAKQQRWISHSSFQWLRSFSRNRIELSSEIKPAIRTDTQN